MQTRVKWTKKSLNTYSTKIGTASECWRSLDVCDMYKQFTLNLNTYSTNTGTASECWWRRMKTDPSSLAIRVDNQTTCIERFIITNELTKCSGHASGGSFFMAFLEASAVYEKVDRTRFWKCHKTCHKKERMPEASAVHKKKCRLLL